ncbi:MAG TPA: hypothetical protein VMZ53_33415 [Kofleriaceae bacterium]|nr:hypothetical protein [Kofleriaceae bacterium]
MRRAFILDLSTHGQAAKDLSVGGVFIENASVDFDDECHIILRAGSEDLTVTARAVQILEGGAGFQIEGMNRELRERIATLVDLAMHSDLDRKKTLPHSLAKLEAAKRSAAGSIPPETRRSARVAAGSISPILGLAPTQQDDALGDKIRAAKLALDREKETDD